MKNLNLTLASLITLVLSVASFLLTGCGSSSGGGSATSDAPPAISETVVSNSPDYTSFSVADASDLPPCTEGIEGALAYIKVSKSFMACASEAWLDIDLRGAKGDRGVDGANGNDGIDGVDGIDAAAQALGDTWVDPDSGLEIWIAAKDEDFTTALVTCAAPWALPTSGFSYKFGYAFFTFLSTLPTSANYWTSVVSASGHEVRPVGTYGQTSSDSADSVLNYTICVK